MSEDVIKIVVDDSELDIALAKAKELASIGTRITGTPDISRGTRRLHVDLEDIVDLESEAVDAIPDFLRTFGSTDLPGVNRELRLILGQIPGMRNLVTSYFRLKRIQRSVGIAIEDETSLGSALLQPQMVLTLIATAILLIQSIATYYKRLKIEERNYERLIRSYKELSHKEFTRIRKEEKNTRRRFPG